MADSVSSMSQQDKVLHLYVEVRSVGEGKELLDRDHRSGLRMLPCPDVLPHLHMSPHQSPDFSPRVPHRSRALTQSLPPSRYSSRNSVNFQLPLHNDPKCPTTAARRSSLCTSVGQLSDSHTPGTSHLALNGPFPQQNDYHSQYKRVPTSSAVGWWSVPSTPTTYRRFHNGYGEDDEEGTVSVARYGYVQKGSVNSGSQRHSLNHYDMDQYAFQNHTHLQKRNSDPGWHYDPEYRPLNKTHSTPPQFRRSTIEAVAKDATHRALREFGSPELNRRYESYSQESGSALRPQQHLSRHSWSSSPSANLHRRSPTLPSRNSHCGVGASVPHTPLYCPSSAASSPSLSAHRFSTNVHHQQFSESNHTTALTRHLPAGKPTDIQHWTSANEGSGVHPCRTAFQTPGSSYHNGGSQKFFDHSTQRQARERSVRSPDNDLLYVPSTYSSEKGSKSPVNGRRFSMSGRTSPVPFVDPSILRSANSYRTFYSENQPNARTHLYLQPHYQPDTKGRRSSQTMAGYSSPHLSPKCLSSSKSLSLPSSLNDTDYLDHPDVTSDYSQGFNPTQKPEFTENHLNFRAEMRPYHHVSANSVRSSPEVARRSTLGPQHASAGRTPKTEVRRGEQQQKCENQTRRGKQEVKSVKNLHEKDSPASVYSTDAPRETGSRQTSRNTDPSTKVREVSPSP